MISVIIPTLNAEATLGKCLAALIPAALDGVVSQVVVADGGSTDHTMDIADAAGADLVSASPGRGGQIRAGIARARAPWLLILHADTVLEAGWEDKASEFIEDVDLGRRNKSAAAFRFALNDTGIFPRLMEAVVHLRSSLARLPYGDQGLLMPRLLHDEVGGFRPLAIMEDVDIVRRLGRRRLTMLECRAVTSPERYRKDGYLRRIARNQMCLLMYAAGVPVGQIAVYYHVPEDRGGLDDPVEHQETAARNINPS